MAGDDRRPVAQRDTEEVLLRRLRLIAGAVILVMIVLLVVVDTLGRLYVDPTFRASELFLGTLIGALLLLLGIEGVSRLPGLPKNGSQK